MRIRVVLTGNIIWADFRPLYRGLFGFARNMAQRRTPARGLGLTIRTPKKDIVRHPKQLLHCPDCIARGHCRRTVFPLVHRRLAVPRLPPDEVGDPPP